MVFWFHAHNKFILHMFKNKSLFKFSKNTTKLLDSSCPRQKFQSPIKSQPKNQFYSTQNIKTRQIKGRNFITNSKTRLRDASQSNYESTRLIHCNSQARCFNLEKMATTGCFTLQNLNISRCKSELIRNKSANQMHKNYRIQMLSQMNSLLSNHSLNTLTNQYNQQIPEAKLEQNKFLFEKKMNAKIDRLENFLYKIKQQRQKQQIPRDKIPFKLVQPGVTQHKEGSRFAQNSKTNAQNLLLELEKLKQQITQTRIQAIQVKKRNSVSRVKQVKEIQIENNFKRIKEEIAKINHLKTQISTPHLFNTPSYSFIHGTESHTNSNFNVFSNYRLNNHVNSQQAIRISSQDPFQANKTHENRFFDSKFLSKPNITFSFERKG